MCHVCVPSECSVFTLSVVFSYLPEQHVVGGLRLFPSNMQRHSFSKRQLAVRVLLDEEEKNVALSDKKKCMWVFLFLDTHCTSYLTCHTIPHIYAPVLLIFRPFLKTKTGSTCCKQTLQAQWTGRKTVQTVGIQQAQTGPDL